MEGGEETTIWLQSRFVNAGIFCIVDILGLWCIHRCLKGLQAYYLYRLARSGHPVPIARSRIPVFSGELLLGITLFGSLFVIANSIAIVIAFCATLFVNGETRHEWTRVNLTNTTTLTGGLASWNQTSTFFSTVASCETNNLTHVAFWPVAFNLSRNQYNATRNTWLLPINATCLKESPNSVPLLSLSCINIDTQSCSVYDQRPDIEIHVEVAHPNKTWNRLVTEFNFSTTLSRLAYGRLNKPTFDLLSRKRGFAFVFQEPIEEFSDRNIAYVFFSDPDNDAWIISAGQFFSEETPPKFSLYRPARITPAKILGPLSNTLAPFRKADLYPRAEVAESSIPLLVKFLFNRFGSAPIATQALKKIPREVTIVYREAIVLYSILLAILIILFFTREIIVFFFVSRRIGISRDEVFATDFNELSKALRRTMERENDIQYSNRHALLGIHVDERGGRRVAPILSPYD